MELHQGARYAIDGCTVSASNSARGDVLDQIRAARGEIAEPKTGTYYRDASERVDAHLYPDPDSAGALLKSMEGLCSTRRHAKKAIGRGTTPPVYPASALSDRVQAYKRARFETAFLFTFRQTLYAPLKFVHPETLPAAGIRTPSTNRHYDEDRDPLLLPSDWYTRIARNGMVGFDKQLTLHAVPIGWSDKHSCIVYESAWLHRGPSDMTVEHGLIAEYLESGDIRDRSCRAFYRHAYAEDVDTPNTENVDKVCRAAKTRFRHLTKNEMLAIANAAEQGQGVPGGYEHTSDVQVRPFFTVPVGVKNVVAEYLSGYDKACNPESDLARRSMADLRDPEHCLITESNSYRCAFAPNPLIDGTRPFDRLGRATRHRHELKARDPEQQTTLVRRLLEQGASRHDRKRLKKMNIVRAEHEAYELNARRERLFIFQDEVRARDDDHASGVGSCTDGAAHGPDVGRYR